MSSFASPAVLNQVVAAVLYLKELAPLLRQLVRLKNGVFRAEGPQNGSSDIAGGAEERKSAEWLSVWSGIPQAIRSLEERSARMQELMDRISAELEGQRRQSEELAGRLARLEEAVAATNQKLHRQAQYLLIATAVGACLVIGALVR
ncbi:MAG: hypothetical protein KatS3mg004_1164 [Bryobacteraceae bacterium]|nr:MAG: hypothetical protein KatS3mg004_1164 [Bryobacteraceae bacterium]